VLESGLGLSLAIWSDHIFGADAVDVDDAVFRFCICPYSADTSLNAH